MRSTATARGDACCSPFNKHTEDDQLAEYMQRERKRLTMINSVLPRFSKRQGVVSKDREGVTKKGQGAAPCKNGLGRTLINDL